MHSAIIISELGPREEFKVQSTLYQLAGVIWVHMFGRVLVIEPAWIRYECSIYVFSITCQPKYIRR